MSGTLTVLPYVRAAASPIQSRRAAKPKLARAWTTRAVLVKPEWAFYRKHTEGMLRRFMRCSLQSGRVPSMLGREMFRGKVTSYRMESFDDMLIFTHDVDKCMRRLRPVHQLLLTRIAIQEYTHEETAEMLKAHRRTVVRRYEEALDLLTGIFLEVALLYVPKSCQEEDVRKTPPSVSLQAAYLVA